MIGNKSDNTGDRIIEIDLHQIYLTLRKWRKLIVGVTLACFLLAVLVNYVILDPIYQADTLLMVTVASEKLQTQATITNPTDATVPGKADKAPMPVLTMNTYLGQLESKVVMKRVLDNISLPGETISTLAKMVEATIVKDSNLIEIKVRHHDPDKACEIANTISTQYLKLMEELMFSSVVVISPAYVPSTPVRPHKALNSVIALILGFVLSLVLVMILEYLDNTLKTPDEFARELNAPVLGLIPIQTDRNTRQGGTP